MSKGDRFILSDCSETDEESPPIVPVLLPETERMHQDGSPARLKEEPDDTSENERLMAFKMFFLIFNYYIYLSILVTSQRTTNTYVSIPQRRRACSE